VLTFKNLFLPGGLLLAIVLALLMPQPAALFQAWGLIPAFVAIIFLFNGWHFKWRGAKLGWLFLRAFAASMLISLVLGPLMGFAAAQMIQTDPVFTSGLIVMAAVPVTLSSAIVVSDISRGNQAWALFLTIGLNLCGILSLPLLLPWLLRDAGAVEVSSMELFRKLVLLVLVPFGAGIFLRKVFSRATLPKAFHFVPSTCVILTVYAAFGAAREDVMQAPLSAIPLLGGASLAIHLALMALAWGASWLLRLQVKERNTLLFITSQKTLPVALSVLTSVAPGAALAIIPCLLFHLLQLLLDSFLAPHLAPKSS
jgi:sodium/bile acid cotransporter 7